MDYLDAIDEILEAASTIKLPHYRLDVVAIARREFARRGSCDIKFIDPIENALRDCLKKWTFAQKREIWLTTETGWGSEVALEDYPEDSIDMDLEGELMSHIIDQLSPPGKGSEGEEDEF